LGERGKHMAKVLGSSGGGLVWGGGVGGVVWGGGGGGGGLGGWGETPPKGGGLVDSLWFSKVLGGKKMC